MNNDIGALQYTYNTLRYEPQKLNLNIPPALWHAMDESLCKQITRLRQELCTHPKQTPQNKKSSPIGEQYPNITSNKNIDDAIATVQRAATKSLTDDNSISTIEDDLFDFTSTPLIRSNMTT
jgi:hypothetical protein